MVKSEVRGSVLVGSVLYCSFECARDDGRSLANAREVDPEHFNTEDYGALCPVCEREYPEF